MEEIARPRISSGIQFYFLNNLVAAAAGIASRLSRVTLSWRDQWRPAGGGNNSSRRGGLPLRVRGS